MFLPPRKRRLDEAEGNGCLKVDERGSNIPLGEIKEEPGLASSIDVIILTTHCSETIKQDI